MSPLYSDCVSITLDIQPAKRMRRMPVACLPLP
jgi:hypothetical protein